MSHLHLTSSSQKDTADVLTHVQFLNVQLGIVFIIDGHIRLGNCYCTIAVSSLIWIIDGDLNSFYFIRLDFLN